MATYEKVKSKSIHEAGVLLKGNCQMQIDGVEVSIPVLAGDGGIGKTAHISNMCKTSGWKLIDIHYGLKPLEEVSGLPDFGQNIELNGQRIKRTNWTLPDILGDAWDAHYENPDTGIVILFDDFHASPPPLMALGYELFTSKKLRGYPFPPKTAFVLAMNVSGSKSLANHIPAPIVNRLFIMPVVPDFEYWKTQYAMKTPDRFNPKILAFLSNSKYRAHFQGEEMVNKPWPSARQWSRLSKLLNPLEEFYKDKGVPQNDVAYIAAGHVGEEAAQEFTQYYKLFAEVRPEEVFNGTLEIQIPQENSKKYIYIAAISSEFIGRCLDKNSTQESVDKDSEIFVKVCLEMAKEASEFAVVGMREVALVQSPGRNLNLYQIVRKKMSEKDPKTWELIRKDIQEL